MNSNQTNALSENRIVWGTLSNTDSVQVTYGFNITYPADIRTTSMSEIINTVKTDKLRNEITHIRQLHRQRDYKASKAEKQRLPYFIMALFDGYRKTEYLTSITGLVININHIVDIEVLIDQIRYNIPEAHFAFKSSTDGIKIVFVFKHPIIVTNQNRFQIISDFKRIHNYWCNVVSEKLMIEVERNCNDPGRACFLSWDRCAFHRNAYIDWNK